MSGPGPEIIRRQWPVSTVRYDAEKRPESRVKRKSPSRARNDVIDPRADIVRVKSKRSEIKTSLAALRGQECTCKKIIIRRNALHNLPDEKVRIAAIVGARERPVICR